MCSKVSRVSHLDFGSLWNTRKKKEQKPLKYKAHYLCIARLLFCAELLLSPKIT